MHMLDSHRPGLRPAQPGYSFKAAQICQPPAPPDPSLTLRRASTRSFRDLRMFLKICGCSPKTADVRLFLCQCVRVFRSRRLSVKHNTSQTCTKATRVNSGTALRRHIRLQHQCPAWPVARSRSWISSGFTSSPARIP